MQSRLHHLSPSRQPRPGPSGGVRARSRHRDTGAYLARWATWDSCTLVSVSWAVLVACCTYPCIRPSREGSSAS